MTGHVNGRPEPIEVPPFVQRRDDIDDESDVRAWDGWVVQSTGDPKRDYELGEHYAGIAVDLATEHDRPSLITFTLSAIYLKQAMGLITAGEIERGFIDRIARLACLGAKN